ncbi:MAG: glycosyltransferase [Pyrinomonadaceae bacterium]
MWAFYFLAALVLWQSVVSLVGGFRYLAYVRREAGAKRPLFMPSASVIVPCRGMDEGLRANIGALFDQHYPSYELVFVSDRADDPALSIIEDVRRQYEGRGVPSVRVIVAGRARACGQKVHNLRAAVGEVDPSSEVLVFVDTDARPRRDWLRALVAPLADASIGAATGYRWFLPVVGNFASHLRAVWNASITSALGPRRDRNFCWGGSTAIRRATFERLNVLEEWRGALSDDYALTRALQRAKLPIHFVPDCLTASHEDCDFAQLVEFTTRQLKITRVYAPHLWKIVLISNLLWVAVFYGGIAIISTRAALGLTFALPLTLVCLIYLLGIFKASLRLRAVASPPGPLAGYRSLLSAGALVSHLFLWPLASALYTYNALAAAFSRRITWRGMTYELKSPRETVIISGVPAEDLSQEETVTDEREPASHAR